MGASIWKVAPEVHNSVLKEYGMVPYRTVSESILVPMATENILSEIAAAPVVEALHGDVEVVGGVLVRNFALGDAVPV